MNYQELHYYIACCYHPPKPTYDPSEFITELVKTVESIIIDAEASSVILLTDDFNRLHFACLEPDYGLAQIVNDPTHEVNFLDRVYTNRPGLFCATMHKSHLSVIGCVRQAAQTDINFTEFTVYLRILFYLHCFLAINSIVKLKCALYLNEADRQTDRQVKP